MSADRESAARTSAIIALTLIGFPLVWPVHVARGLIRGRRHRARMSRLAADDGPALARVRAGEASAAVLSSETTHSLASGPEEEACLELTFGAESVVVRPSEALDEALRAQGVKVREEEALASGLGILFAWAMWGVSVVALASFITSPSFLVIAGVIGVAGVLALVLT